MAKRINESLGWMIYRCFAIFVLLVMFGLLPTPHTENWFHDGVLLTMPFVALFSLIISILEIPKYIKEKREYKQNISISERAIEIGKEMDDSIAYKTIESYQFSQYKYVSFNKKNYDSPNTNYLIVGDISQEQYVEIESIKELDELIIGLTKLRKHLEENER